ncbi:hypothetical protein LXL04_011135 [Taraxacum kok-saghyz]
MAPEMLCKLPKVYSSDNFDDLVMEDMELDEEVIRELLEEVYDDNMDQISIMENVVSDMPPSKHKNGDSSHVLFDHESQIVFYDDKQIQDFDYWISQQFIELPCSFPGLSFENEMIPFWNVENRIEEVMVDDIVYVELWKD